MCARLFSHTLSSRQGHGDFGAFSIILASLTLPPSFLNYLSNSPWNAADFSDEVSFLTEERLCREARFGATAAPPGARHPEPSEVTARKAAERLAAACSPPPPAPRRFQGMGEAPPLVRPGIDDGPLGTLAGRAQCRLLLAGLAEVRDCPTRAAAAAVGCWGVVEGCL